MPAFELKLLGRFQLLDHRAEEIKVRSKKVRALVAYLGLNGDRPQERDFLAGLLWADRFDAQARQSLRQALLTIRRCLGPGVDALLEIDNRVVAMRTQAVLIDAVRFQSLLAEGNSAAATELFQGELLSGLDVSSEAFDAWLLAERQRLNELACTCFETHGQQQLEAGEPAAAILAARRATAIDPFRESAHRLLMLALSSSRRPAEAMQHYKRLQAMLREQLGTAPDGETTRCMEAIRVAAEPRVRLSASARGESASPAAPAGERPSVAVLPFANLTGDPDQDYFSDGISQEIITALSKSRMCYVRTRSSTMGYRNAPLAVTQIADELQVRFVVEGSIRGAGQQLRMAAELIDAGADRQVWADHYDCCRQDVFAVQDRIIERIVGAIAPELVSAEFYRVRRLPEQSFDAWDLFMRAFWHVIRITRDDMLECRRLCQEAIDLDRNNSAPFGLLCITHLYDAIYNWGGSREAALRHGREAALQGIGLDDHDTLAVRGLAHVDFWSGNLEAAIDGIRRAIQLDPYEAENHAVLGRFLGMSGDYDSARKCLGHALELSPRDFNLAAWYNNIAVVAVAARDYQGAVELARNCIRINPNFPGGYRSLAAALGQLGRQEEAGDALTRLYELLPDLSLADVRDLLPFKNPGDLEHYLDGLRKAGMSA